MSTTVYSPRIGIYGADDAANLPSKGCGLWSAGYAASVTAAGATPVVLRRMPGCSWDDLLDEVDGVIFADGHPVAGPRQAEQERLVEWCRELSLPLLAVDHGMHVLNTTFGGTLYLDLHREVPQALQHQHMPEPGDRHAINVEPGSRLARCYGEGEVVVNSEHRRGLCKVAPGFVVSARALDGVIECVEPESEGWYCLGVQWHPASTTASGLDIQLFRGFADACRERQQTALRTPPLVAA